MHGQNSRVIDLKTIQLERQTSPSQGPVHIPFPRLGPSLCRNRACVHHGIPLNYSVTVYFEWNVGENLSSVVMSRAAVLRQFFD